MRSHHHSLHYRSVAHSQPPCLTTNACLVLIPRRSSRININSLSYQHSMPEKKRHFLTIMTTKTLTDARRRRRRHVLDIRTTLTAKLTIIVVIIFTLFGLHSSPLGSVATIVVQQRRQQQSFVFVSAFSLSVRTTIHRQHSNQQQQLRYKRMTRPETATTEIPSRMQGMQDSIQYDIRWRRNGRSMSTNGVIVSSLMFLFVLLPPPSPLPPPSLTSSSSAPQLSPSLLSLSQPAHALKERNEILCGTGFFTNIAQYMCTDIGDISDEGGRRGIGRTLNEDEIASTDSLMSKMSMSSSQSSSSSSSPDGTEMDQNAAAANKDIFMSKDEDTSK
jgi:hypothetical protein